MNKKTLETICFLFIIIVFIIIGYYTYKSYEEKKSSNDVDTEINNFYDVEYLFNSGYIDVPKTATGTIEDVNIHVNNNMLYINNTSNNKKSGIVAGLPEDSTVYFNHLYDFCYEFLAKTKDGDAYYSYVDLDIKHNFTFTLVGNNVDKVYVPVYDKKNVYINSNSIFSTNYIILSTDNTLKYIDYNKGYKLSDNLIEKKPYFDYVCASFSDICSKTMVYITFKNELYYNNKPVKYNNEIIHVTDVFSTFEISNKKIDINLISAKDLKKYKYLYDVYIIDDNKDLYKLEISNNNSTIEKLSIDTNKVKEYMYETDPLKLTIVFGDGLANIMKDSQSLKIGTSTIYDKKDNSEKMLVKP